MRTNSPTGLLSTINASWRPILDGRSTLLRRRCGGWKRNGTECDSICTDLKVRSLSGGLSALGAGLYSIGIPKDSILQYETSLKSDKYLVIAHGTADEAARAKELLAPLNIAEVVVHHG